MPSAEQQLASTVVSTLLDTQEYVRIGDLEAAFVRGIPARAVERIPWQEINRQLFVRLEADAVQILRDAGTAAIHDLPRSQLAKASPADLKATFGFGFDETNPQALAWARQHAAEFVTEVTGTSRDAVRQVIIRMFTDNVPPAVAARELFAIIGLDAKSAVAVDNFRRELIAQGQPEKTVIRLVRTYSERLRRRRAQIMAQHEAHVIQSRGQLELWRQARAKGLIEDARTLKEWITTKDERLCRICAPMHGQRRLLDEPFESPTNGAQAMSPGIHIRCRCAQKLVFAQPNGEFVPPPAPFPVPTQSRTSRSLRPRVPAIR